MTNPKMYSSDHIHPIKKMKASVVWKLDKIKNEFAENMGYSVLVIWEQDYYHNKDAVITKCLTFLGE